MSRFKCLESKAVRVGATIVACVGFARGASDIQNFALSDINDLTLLNVKADAVEYNGRKAIRITKDAPKDGFALLRGSDFQDGVIEGSIALKITTPPGVRMPGFVGIAFRARPDASHYELFYLRPGNSHAEDQAMRNHSVQYSSAPDFGWYRLRREWPLVYETYEELQPETWTKIRIEVKGRSAKLYLHGSQQPTLIVDGLKGEDLRGGVALWGYQGEEAYFSDFRITPSTTLPIKNGSDAAGAWQVRFASDYGLFNGTLDLKREGSALTGTWSGALGDARPVKGTWRNGYVELSFDAEWRNQPKADPSTVAAMLEGWIDGDAARGRMTVHGRADGVWTATRKPAEP